MSFVSRLASPAGALRILSVALGVFLIFMAIDKIEWLTDSTFLTERLQEWRDNVRPMARWYLDTIAIPGAPVFARLVVLAELAAGSALILGVKVRLAAALAFLMVLHFHLASDLVFRYSYLINAYGLPILGGLLALAVGGRGLPFSVSRN
jgi:uncharacterized membrane protein YphA (DoxX/SURF4 family)